MKNRKFHYQKLPKAWQNKKKTSSFRFKRPSPLQKQQKKKPFNRNKMAAKKPSSWKTPGILFLAGFMILILILPTVIVLPDKSEKAAQVKTDYSGDKTEETSQKKDTDQSDAADQAVNLSEGDSPFSVEVMRASSEEVDDVPLETYVARVVASEMPIEFETEALKAQALTARTYIVDLMMHQDEEEDGSPAVTDTTDNQVYHDENQLQKQWGEDFDKNMEKINQAVAETKGEILTYEDDPIFPAFFSTSNGRTENSEDYWDDELPYLRSVESPWDEDSPKFMDQKIVSVDEAEEALGVELSGDLNDEESRTDGDRIQTVTIGDKEFSGKDIREMFDLRSSDFTMKQKNDHVIFKTKGFGHGIGMSQYGANGMAKDGKDYKEIVNHYYQDIDIEKVTDTAPMLVAK